MSVLSQLYSFFLTARSLLIFKSKSSQVAFSEPMLIALILLLCAIQEISHHYTQRDYITVWNYNSEQS